MGRLLLLFTAVPLIELFLLLRIGSAIGLGPTIALVLLTGAIGAWLARSEGTRVLRRWQRALEQGRVPEEGVLDGLLVLVGGVLLVTPGVMTDAIGLALLLPPTRRAIGVLVRRQVERGIARGNVQVFTWSGGRGTGFSSSWGAGSSAQRRGGTPSRPRSGSGVIDAEGEEVRDPPGPSGS